MDEGNKVAENGFYGAIRYTEQNNLATIGSTTVITLKDENSFQTKEGGNHKIWYHLIINELTLTVKTFWGAGTALFGLPRLIRTL